MRISTSNCLPLPNQLVFLCFQDGGPFFDAKIVLRDGIPYWRVVFGPLITREMSLNEFPFNCHSFDFFFFLERKPYPKAQEVMTLFKKRTDLEILFDSYGKVIGVYKGYLWVRFVELLEPFVKEGIFRKGEGETDFYIV